MSSHPLEDTFDLDPSEAVKKMFGMDIEIPDDPSIMTVVKLALDQYKTLAEEAMLLEGAQKLEQMELAKQFLQIAKDAMWQNGDLGLKSRRIDITEKKTAPTKQIPNSPEIEGEVSRDDVWDAIEAARNNQK